MGEIDQRSQSLIDDRILCEWSLRESSASIRRLILVIHEKKNNFKTTEMMYVKKIRLLQER